MPNEPIERNTGAAPLPPTLRTGLQSMSGIDMSDVEVQGSQIHLAPGEEHPLPHEAWHVVQQTPGRVVATGTVNGEPLNDDPALEREADIMGSRARRRQA